VPVLQENLECEIDRAAALQEIDRVVQVDVVARSEDERALSVVAGAGELLVAPVLHPIRLGAVVCEFEFCRRHFSRPSAVGDLTHSLFVH
jgi:hypothetical protein